MPSAHARLPPELCIQPPPKTIRASADTVRKRKREIEWLNAARSGDLERLRALLGRNGGRSRPPALLQAQDKSGWTALHYAALSGHARVIELLLDAGAPCDPILDQTAHTPLHVAAYGGHAESVEALLAARASTDARARCGRLPATRTDGLTALFYGAASGSARVVRELLSHGALPSARTTGLGADNSPLNVARLVAAAASGARQAECAKSVKMIASEVKRLDRWQRSVRMCDLDGMKECLQTAPSHLIPARCFVNGGLVFSMQWRPALHVCAMLARRDAVVWLLEQGADVRACDDDGNTVLHALAISTIRERRAGGELLLPVLLAAGARIDARNKPLECGHCETAMDKLVYAGWIPPDQRAGPRNTGPVRCARLFRLGDALLAASARAARFRRFRAAARVAGVLRLWHARAVERAYAPGGGGYMVAAAEFEASRAAKSRRLG